MTPCGRNARGRFITGNSGGPGRPKGSRNRLGEDFPSVLYADWSENGAAVIAEVREPSCVSPRRRGPGPATDGITNIREEVAAMTDEELNQAMVRAAMVMGWQLVPPADGEPALPGPE